MVGLDCLRRVFEVMGFDTTLTQFYVCKLKGGKLTNPGVVWTKLVLLPDVFDNVGFLLGLYLQTS